MITIKQLNIGYNSSLLKKNFSINYPKHGLIALIGNNGTGKTTFIKTLAAIYKPLNGEVFIKKYNIHNSNYHQRAKLVSVVLSYLPQKLELTVKQILNLTIKLNQTKLQSNYLEYLYSKLKICNLLNKSFSKLSDGQKQKVMIARAFAQNTPIVLLDEPFSHLDYSNFKLVKELLLKEKQKKLIIFTTHNLLSITNIDNIWHLENKEIIPKTVNQFMTHSPQIIEFYNFYNSIVVNNKKEKT